MFLVPFGPTHHSISAYTLLDLVIVDDLNKLLNFQQPGNPILSSHELIFFDFTLNCKPVSHFSSNYRDFSKFNSADFLYNNNSNETNCDMCLNNLNQSLLQIFNTFAFLRTYNSKRPAAPWITPDTKSQICFRERLRARFRRNSNVDNKQLFVAQRNRVQELICDSRIAYTEGKISGFLVEMSMDK